jgi:hypothetical protein
MALIDRPKRRPKPVAPAGSGEPFATINADRFEETREDSQRQRLMQAADRYNVAAKQRDR